MPTVVSVECKRLERRTQPQKQAIYCLLLHWSDGSVTETEKSHSALLDFRTTLKKNYGDKHGIQIPEVPSLKKFEFGTASKKDEKRKKSVEDFFMQLMKLPAIVGKVNLVMEFFASHYLEDDGAYSDADRLAFEFKEQEKKGPSSIGKANGVSGNEKKNNKNTETKKIDEQHIHGKNSDTCVYRKLESVEPADLTTLYSEVAKPKPNVTCKAGNVNYISIDVQQPGDKDGFSSSVPLSAPSLDTLYAEITPKSTSNPSNMLTSVSSAKPQVAVKNSVDGIKQHSSVDSIGKMATAFPSQFHPSFETGNNKSFNAICSLTQPAVDESDDMDQSYNGPQYQNFPVTSQITSEDRKLYIVTESFIPGTAYSQYLAVENGDIVEVQAASGDKVFCTLHATQFRLLEGWLPRNILKLVPPDFQHHFPSPLVQTPSKPSVHLTDFFTQESQLQESVGNSATTKATKITDAPSFVGSLSRCDCERLLMTHGKQLDFVIRESSNLVGQFALSVKHNDHVHHFPIVLTEDNKFYIGKHHFKTVDNVVAYYRRNDLFVDEDGSAVRLGNPLMMPTFEGNLSLSANI